MSTLYGREGRGGGGGTASGVTAPSPQSKSIDSSTRCEGQGGSGVPRRERDETCPLCTGGRGGQATRWGHLLG